MKNVEIVMIPVKDQQKAKEFYLKLGMELIAEEPMGNGEIWVQLGYPNETTTLSLAKFQGIIFETTDIENNVRELKSKDIEVEKIDDTAWGKFAWLKDPDGNGLCLHQK